MTPKTITIIAMRFFAVYVLFQIAASIGILITYQISPEFRSFEMLEYQVFLISIYVLAVIILYTYSGKIADKITKLLPKEKFHASCSTVELLTVLIIAISIFTIISAIPRVVNQLNAVLTAFHSELSDTVPMRQRFNIVFFGLLGALFQMIISIVLIYKAKPLAVYLEKIQKKKASPKQQLPAKK